MGNKKNLAIFQQFNLATKDAMNIYIYVPTYLEKKYKQIMNSGNYFYHKSINQGYMLA